MHCIFGRVPGAGMSIEKEAAHANAPPPLPPGVAAQLAAGLGSVLLPSLYPFVPVLAPLSPLLHPSPCAYVWTECHINILAPIWFFLPPFRALFLIQILIVIFDLICLFKGIHTLFLVCSNLRLKTQQKVMSCDSCPWRCLCIVEKWLMGHLGYTRVRP